MEKCFIVGGGKISDNEWLRSVSKQYDFIISSDKGYTTLKRADIAIDLAIGDFDSLGCVPDDVKVIKLKVEKDDTDTMSAVRYALDNGAKEITLAGGIGGRLDHTIANIQTLSFILSHNAVGRLIDENNEIIGLAFGEYEFKRRKGYSLSVFSMSDEVTGLCEKGVKFPLGVSNEIIKDSAFISFKSGIALVCFSKL